jgi:hypothetical protein
MAAKSTRKSTTEAVEPPTEVLDETDEQPVEARAAASAFEPEVPEEAPIKAPRGHQLLRYVGHADVVEHGEYRFRPGEWVVVPKGVAEELMTFPFEAFEGKMEAEGDDDG